MVFGAEMRDRAEKGLELANGQSEFWRGVPLTITPPSNKHRLDAEVRVGIGQKGIEPKVRAQIC